MATTRGGAAATTAGASATTGASANRRATVFSDAGATTAGGIAAAGLVVADSTELVHSAAPVDVRTQLVRDATGDQTLTRDYVRGLLARIALHDIRDLRDVADPNSPPELALFTLEAYEHSRLRLTQLAALDHCLSAAGGGKPTKAQRARLTDDRARTLAWLRAFLQHGCACVAASG